MGKINAIWHDSNPMPKNPTLDQRIAWHVAHAKRCGCRPVPEKLREQMTKRGINVPVFKD